MSLSNSRRRGANLQDGSTIKVIKDFNFVDASLKNLINISQTKTTFAKDVQIKGNLTVDGNSTTVNSSSLTIDDPLIKIGDGLGDLSTDNLDGGLLLEYRNTGTNTKNWDAFYRDKTTKQWTLRQNITTEPTSNVIGTTGSLGSLSVGSLNASGRTSVNYQNPSISLRPSVSSASEICGVNFGHASDTHTKAGLVFQNNGGFGTGNLAIVNNISANTNSASISNASDCRIFMPGGSNRVGICNSSPTTTLHVSGSITNENFPLTTGSITCGSIRSTGGGSSAILSTTPININFDNSINGSNGSLVLYDNTTGFNKQMSFLCKSITGGWNGLVQANDSVIVAGYGSSIGSSTLAALTITTDSGATSGIRVTGAHTVVQPRLGIAMSNPTVPLDVGTQQYAGNAAASYLSSTGVDYNTSFPMNLGGRFAAALLATQFFTYSDQRIKKDIVDLEDDECLGLLRQIQPKKYKYIDQRERGSQQVYGFIAQEIAQVLPYAVETTQKLFIPSIMKAGLITQVDETQVLIQVDSHGMADGENIQLKYYVYDEDGNENVRMKSACVIDANHLVLEVDPDDSHVFELDEQVFVYGQEIEDFHTIDRHAIYTVAVSAIQELDRQVSQQKTLIESLVSRIEALENANTNPNPN